MTHRTSADASRTRAAISICLALAASLVVAGCATDDASTTTTVSTTSPGPTARADGPASLSHYPALPPPPAPTAGTIRCTYTPVGTATPPGGTPSSSTSASGTVDVTLQTSVGPIPLVLDRALAPCAVNNFENLAASGFYDDTSCHRLLMAPGTQLYQCGDPTGTGTGGPGYTFASEYPVPAFAADMQESYRGLVVVYPRGTVAMTGHDNNNGSQFFLLLGDSALRPDYTVFGRIADSALPALDAAAATGDDGSSPLGGGVPNTPLVITAVR
ncbi:peptidylprolyl isomerase [Rhodococcus chondri]|uniref:Peptidylprolyl isomerase n=1 Tax=Rhodococcus chondri TaxID=3065941 RepID=A0ABU7JRR8_9NOCA|nr:peptidylprolyl isomerase [Rhodococcus sp. CC-R104]MEE2032720.1 peptidylprolyl isomerase [Rhodococcus sp. CC-R104]